MDNRMLNNMAVQILFTANPSINLSANSIIRAFITNRNRPKVTTVIGKVNTINMGFTNTFNIAKTNATMIAVVISLPDSVTPGKK
jgi:hypothetical protein